MAIAGFTLEGMNRRTIRTPVNPLDKSSVVSIYPREIMEIKPTLQPGYFNIKPGTYDKPSILIVGPSSWWKELDPDQPMLEVPVGSVQIAESIVKDFANGLFCCDMGANMPGLFFVPGELTLDKLKKDYKVLLDEALAKQRNWFAALVKAADMLWARSNGNPLSISDDMRLAALELQLSDKPWIKDFKTMKLENCPACGELYDSNYPMCRHCRTIVNKKLYQEKGFIQANA
jgi:hypothetical protein